MTFRGSRGDCAAQGRCVRVGAIAKHNALETSGAQEDEFLRQPTGGDCGEKKKEEDL